MIAEVGLLVHWHAPISDSTVTGVCRVAQSSRYSKVRLRHKRGWGPFFFFPIG